MGIRGQLALLVAALVGLTLVGLGFATAAQERVEQTEALELRHAVALETVGITVAANVAQNDVAALDALMSHLAHGRGESDLLEVAVYDDEGRVLAHTTPTLFNTVESDPFVRRAIASSESVFEVQGMRLRVGVPAESGLRWATVVGSYSLETLEASVARGMRRWFASAGFLAVALGLVLFFGLHFTVLRPLRGLRRTAVKMGKGDLGARARPSGGRELRDLAVAFNRMATALRAERDNLEATVEDRTRDLREANVQLERLAVTDGLTGLFNHRRFQETLTQEVLRAGRSGRPLSVIMVDVDHFKRFNDTFGHPAGDALLRRLSAVILAEIRSTDVPSRYGGEEFALLLPETPKDEALRVAERLRAAVERDLGVNAQGVQVSVSVGVATLGLDSDGQQALIEAADRALYEAKHGGRNRVVAARRVA